MKPLKTKEIFKANYSLGIGMYINAITYCRFIRFYINLHRVIYTVQYKVATIIPLVLLGKKTILVKEENAPLRTFFINISKLMRLA